MRNQFIPFTFALLLCTPIAISDENEHSPTLVSEQITHQPTAVPDRIVLNWTDDPATSQAVTWRTDTTVQTPVAELAVAEAGPRFALKAIRTEGVTTRVKTDLGSAQFHTVQFTGLQPKTKYLYRVGDGVNWSEWILFQTASPDPEPFTFIYFGDAQNAIKSHWSRVIREAYRKAPEARFIIHAGDLINRSQRDAEWGEWFYAGGWVHATLPSIVTPGNHEYTERDENDNRILARYWRPQFALPTNGPDGLKETAYYIDYQGVRFISLNSNEQLEAQVRWLDDVLSNNPNRWTILTFHHPIFSAAPRRDNEHLRTLWKPVFDRHGVDLVLQGHDHTYGRSGLIGTNVGEGANVKDAGTVYVVSVSGPKMYPGEKQDWMEKQLNHTQLFQVITMDGDLLRYTSYNALGEPYDTFELHKSSTGPNELIELNPRTAPMTNHKPSD